MLYSTALTPEVQHELAVAGGTLILQPTTGLWTLDPGVDVCPLALCFTRAAGQDKGWDRL